MVLTLILGALALAGWGMAAGYRWTLSNCRLEIEEMQAEYESRIKAETERAEHWRREYHRATAIDGGPW